MTKLKVIDLAESDHDSENSCDSSSSDEEEHTPVKPVSLTRKRTAQLPKATSHYKFFKEQIQFIGFYNGNAVDQFIFIDDHQSGMGGLGGPGDP